MSRDDKDRLRQIVEAYERDRESLALELHDNVLQTLSSALHHIQAADQDVLNREQRRQNLLKALHLIRQTIDAARGLMEGLRPPVLDRLGIVETMRYDLRQLREETNWQVQFNAEGAAIPRELELPLYRILREAITNARRHSHCRSLQVQLLVQPSEVAAEVRDDGCGFDPNMVPRDRVGLLSMRTRAGALGGECHILSAVGEGTTVVVRLPLWQNPQTKTG